MQLRFINAFKNGCDKPKTMLQKLRFQQNVQNSRDKILRRYRFFLSNRNIDLDNFKQYKNDPVYLDRCEIETRIMKRLYNSQLVDLKKFSFNQDFQELKLDSLDLVVVLTEIQEEFTTVFEDRVFESVRRLEEIVDLLVKDQKVF